MEKHYKSSTLFIYAKLLFVIFLIPFIYLNLSEANMNHSSKDMFMAIIYIFLALYVLYYLRHEELYIRGNKIFVKIFYLFIPFKTLQVDIKDIVSVERRRLWYRESRHHETYYYKFKLSNSNNFTISEVFLDKDFFDTLKSINPDIEFKNINFKLLEKIAEYKEKEQLPSKLLQQEHIEFKKHYRTQDIPNSKKMSNFWSFVIGYGILISYFLYMQIANDIQDYTMIFILVSIGIVFGILFFILSSRQEELHIKDSKMKVIYYILSRPTKIIEFSINDIYKIEKKEPSLYLDTSSAANDSRAYRYFYIFYLKNGRKFKLSNVIFLNNPEIFAHIKKLNPNIEFDI